VNTRLQVEHPITELTIGQDLLRWQILVAAGQKLPLTQEEIQPRGHAIECRICAEDPEQNFMPSTGQLMLYRPPEGPFIRVDSGVREGSEVSVYYDPMLAKLIVWAPDRDSALNRMSRALKEFVIVGVANNAMFLRSIIDHPAFRAGDSHTHFLAEHQIPGKPASGNPLIEDLALAIAAAPKQNLHSTNEHGSSTKPVRISPWATSDGWRNHG